MSALPPKADIRQRIEHVCFVPLADMGAYQETRMPALRPMPSRSSPKLTSTLAKTDGEAVGLKKFTPAETSRHL